MNSSSIENHGVIGDLHTVALVTMEASIDFMCFPRFDSPSIFAALLDREKGGYFQIAPASGEFKHRQRYMPDTNILLTRFLGEPGIAEVSDFMPMQQLGNRQGLVRRVKVVRGEMPFRMVCEPKFDYARGAHTVNQKANGLLVFTPKKSTQPALQLRSSVPLRIENGAAVANFKLRAGQIAWFVLEKANDGESSSSEAANFVSESFKETMNYWLSWIARCQYRGRWRETVYRSALTLKMLTSRNFGSIVAAPTFGLPETIGGERNWDYRFTWIRDASFTLDALMRLGYTEEAQSFIAWIADRCREHPQSSKFQIMYRVDGKGDLREEILKNFAGYENSRPVRIGNGAARQMQLDIYGELIDAIFIYEKHGGMISYDFWTNLTRFVDWVSKNWQRPDNGIWETRGGPKRFLYSRILCWVALDRAIRIAQKRSFPGPLVRWHRIRDEIWQDLYNNFWNAKMSCFVQYRGATTVDASCLLMPLATCISPADPRWESTMKVIEKLLVEDSLVYRYRSPDGLKGEEGTFAMCSFWFVECVARAGDLKKARFLFEKALGYANHLGLFAEQLGPCGEQLGNFPQALSHIALISAAWTLNQKLTDAGGEPVILSELGRE